MGILAILTRFSFFQLQADLQLIKEDVITIEKKRQELVRARERYSVKLHMILNTSNPVAAHDSGGDETKVKNESGTASSSKEELRETIPLMTNHKRNILFGAGSVDSSSKSEEPIASQGTSITKKKKVLAQVCSN